MHIFAAMLLSRAVVQPATARRTGAARFMCSVAHAALVDVADLGAGVSMVTLNQPGRRNALSLAMLEALHDAVLSARESAGVKTVILAARGPVFCAGHDLRELLGADRGAVARTFDLCSRVMQDIVHSPKPFIAQVHALATAAGCQLVASCDLAVASDRASFATPGVNVGLFCSTPAVALGRSVARKRALEMLLTGEPIDAAAAERAGLVSRVVPHDQLEACTLELARKVASKPAHVIALGKRAFNQQIDLPLHAAYEVAGATMVRNLTELPDGREGLTAFVEKRAPVWRSA